MLGKVLKQPRQQNVRDKQRQKLGPRIGIPRYPVITKKSKASFEETPRSSRVRTDTFTVGGSGSPLVGELRYSLPTAPPCVYTQNLTLKILYFSSLNPGLISNGDSNVIMFGLGEEIFLEPEKAILYIKSFNLKF